MTVPETTPETETAPDPAPSPLDRLLARRFDVNWTLVLYLAIFAAAFVLRFLDLGFRALHHDESIHAVWSLDFLDGNYNHDPAFHGPLLYVLQGFAFLVFTATDYTSRISPALFGVAVVAMPFAFRRWLGPTGVMAAVAFLAFSPTLVYYSRFLRMDIFLALLFLVMVAALWSYLHGGRVRALILYAVALALAFATKEAAFLLVAFVLLYLNGHLALDLAAISLRDGPHDTPWRRFRRAAALYPVAWIIAALWPVFRLRPGWALPVTEFSARGPRPVPRGFARLRARLRWEHLPRTGDLLVITGTLTLPLLTPFARGLLEAIFPSGLFGQAEVCAYPTTRDALAIGGAFIVTGAIATIAGLLWRPRLWLVIAALAVLIYTSLMTSFWTNLDGLCTGAWGSLDYWLDQQEVRRGDQPWFYYLMLMPAYEFLPLAIALVGGVWAFIRGPAFARFLVLWFVVVFAALSFAGEKMPWLNTHLAIPAILLAAWTLQRAWSHWNPPRLPFPMLCAIAFALAAASLGFALLALDWGPLGGRLAWSLSLLALAAAAFLFLASRLGRRSLPLLAALAVAASLAFFSFRTMTGVTFERSDEPRDMLIYVQSAADIPRLRDDIAALAESSGKGRDLCIAVDSAITWPWPWYLRDYSCRTFHDFGESLPEGEYDVLLVHYGANSSIVAEFLGEEDTGFTEPVRYVHRHWFPETYKEVMWGCARDADGLGGRRCEPYMAETWRKIASNVFRGSWARDGFAYWRDHEPRASLQSVDGHVYFREGFDQATGEFTEVPEPPPGADAPPTFGEYGDNPGKFLAPVDIGVGVDGSIYVVDRETALLQHFDPDGEVLFLVDLRADNPAAGPWGLAVGPGGAVFVADTLGSRVLGFTPDLRTRFHAFGGPPQDAGAAPGPFELSAPRDLAVSVAGDIWVVDSGHNRIVVYNAAGQYRREIGAPFDAATGGKGAGPGEFDAPSSIAIAPNGEVVVADRGNARVQVLSATGAYLREFPVVGWSAAGGDLDWPYLTVLRDGRIALSLPALGEVRLYSPEGALLTTIAPAANPLLSPYGIVETPANKLWIVEGGASRVRLYDHTPDDDAGEER